MRSTNATIFPMFYLQAYGVAFLELTFIIVTLMLLHGLKPVVGNISFYLSLGGIMVFAQFVSAAGLNISNAYPGLDINIGPTIFFTPLMAALLITYIVDGTLEAQRMILGIMGLVAIFLYFSFLSERQCDFPGYELYPSVPKSFLGPIFHSGRNFMLASLLSILVVFLVLPVVYQILRNRNIGLGVSVFAALIFTEVLDAFFYELVTNYPADDWWEALRQSYLTRAIAMTWVSCLTVVYLGTRKVPSKDLTVSRNALDIITAFLGSYGRAKRLQANVREWEGRYRMVVENANDFILLVAKSGMILDANRIAYQTLGYSIEELSAMNIDTILKNSDGEPCNWNKIWRDLFTEIASKDPASNVYLVGHDWLMATRKGKVHILDTTISPLKIRNSEATLLVARDITRRKELEQEREALQSQLIHSQRMEAVGKLAGGIAHDFNNLLHAIQGSLDRLDTVVEKNSKARELTGTITSAVNRASTLTGQLLGFARAGKYKVVKIEIGDLVRQTGDLFRPMLSKKVKLKVVVHPDPMIVEGDFTQLEQVLLNLLLNAMAALEDRDGTIVFRAEPATIYTPGWSRQTIDVNPDPPMTDVDLNDSHIVTIGKPDQHESGDDLHDQLLMESRHFEKEQGHSAVAETTEGNGIGQKAGMIDAGQINNRQTKPDADELPDQSVSVDDLKYIVVRVRDDGCGIDDATMKRIFEPFFTTKKSKGTGMGLAMAYGCTQNHNGWIHVESVPGKGSEFFVFLPVAGQTC